MNIIQCSFCRRPAAWMIDGDPFCEGHKEAVIREFGVDRFPIRRLTMVEHAFRAAGHFSFFRDRKRPTTKNPTREGQ
jgi:hypothetical protein